MSGNIFWFHMEFDLRNKSLTEKCFVDQMKSSNCYILLQSLDGDTVTEVLCLGACTVFQIVKSSLFLLRLRNINCIIVKVLLNSYRQFILIFVFHSIVVLFCVRMQCFSHRYLRFFLSRIWREALPRVVVPKGTYIHFNFFILLQASWSDNCLIIGK